MASFTATWLKPQLSDSNTMTDAAARSSGRTEGGTIASGRDIPELFPEKWAPVFRRKCDKTKNPRQRARQWEHTPVISITGVFGVKPALLAAAVSVSATAVEGASPTAPQRSHSRKTTMVPVS